MDPDYRLPFTQEFLEKLWNEGRDRVDSVLRNNAGMWGQDEGDYYFVPPVNTEIVACRAGRVVNVDSTPFEVMRSLSHAQLHGVRLVLLDHGDGSFMDYIHLDSRLRVGDQVEQGENLGKLIKAQPKYDPHLHLHHHQFPNGKQISRAESFSNVTFSNKEYEGFRYLGGIPVKRLDP
ncbi:MAG: M23 family metallopeptidase [Nanoarchaeota archaeon]|nr:M23 family metallopeptidase [Nanoarchaeota archaeon]